MVLHSTIAVTTPITPAQVECLFHDALRALGHMSEIIDPAWRHDDDAVDWRPGHCQFQTVPHQGLVVHLRAVYRPAATVRPFPDGEDLPACTTLEIVLATGNAGARDHADVIRAITGLLNHRRLSSQWRFEDHPWRTGTADLNHIPA